MLTAPVPFSELSKSPTSGLLCNFEDIYLSWSHKKQKKLASCKYVLYLAINLGGHIVQIALVRFVWSIQTNCWFYFDFVRIQWAHGYCEKSNPDPTVISNPNPIHNNLTLNPTVLLVGLTRNDWIRIWFRE